jgi:hypothetical protein
MGVAFVVVAFGGFAPTYWAKIAAGSFDGPAIIQAVQLGVLLFAADHTGCDRACDGSSHWGLAGIAVFSFVLSSILVGQMVILKAADARGMGDAARRFSAVALCAWPLMAGFFAMAIAYSRRPQIHKRWTVLLLTGMMTPAIARVFLTLFAPPGADGPPPAFVAIPPSLVADLLLVVAMVRDWRLLGKPHPVYVYGGLILLAEQLLSVPFAATATWMQIATAFERLAG